MSDRPKLSPNMSPYAREHAEKYLDTNGEVGHVWPIPGAPQPLPALLLVTKGRKTGERYANPLLYVKAGGNYVIAASRGGAPRNPGWYKNLVANPEVEVQVKADKFKARARTVSGAERATLWKQLNAMFPTYDEYQKRAGSREIPVIVLEPVKR